MLGTSPNTAFGPSAQPWSARFSLDVPLVACDLNFVAQAFAEAAARRLDDRAFFGTVFLPDTRAEAAVRIGAPSILAQIPDYDSRRVAFEGLELENLQLNNVPQRDWVQIDPRVRNVAREFLLSADAVFSRSRVELERLCVQIDRRFAHEHVAAPLDPGVPPPTNGVARDGITIWAPGLSARDCALFAFAFEEARFPVRVVSAGGEHPPLRAQFLEPSAAADALSRALVIVDASLYDPGSAISLARYGVPIVCAVTSGAHEWIDGVRQYLPWSFRSVYNAAFHALGDDAPPVLRRTGEEADLAEFLDRSRAGLLRRGPLVSVVMPTYNRLAYLAKALESVARQTYEDIEILVVNDGGEAVDDVVRGFARTRVIDLAENRGPIAALNAGIQAARGKYIGLLADDDGFFPDHCSRLASALERTGAAVAHGNEIAIFSERRPDGAYALVGHAAVGQDAVEPSMLLVGNHIGGPAIMLRRDALLEAGCFDLKHGHLADFEAWLRMSKRFDFVHVDRMIAYMGMRSDSSQISAVTGQRTADMHAAVYEAHPTPDRPDVQRRRQAALQGIAASPQTHWPLQLRLDG